MYAHNEVCFIIIILLVEPAERDREWEREKYSEFFSLKLLDTI